MSKAHADEQPLLTEEGDLLPEYHLDDSKSKPNRFAALARRGTTVRLAPDVAEVFYTDEAVNDVPRAIICAMPGAAKKAT